MLKTVDLASELLMKFNRHQPSWSAKALAKALNQNYSTIYRIVKTLHKHDFLAYDDTTKTYSLGISIWQLGQVVDNSMNLESLIRPYLTKLKDLTGESVFFTIRKGYRGITLLAVEPENKVKFTAETGASVPLFPGASYRSILAYQPEEFVEELIEGGLPQYTPNTMTNPNKLRKELEKIRVDGYARSEGEYTPDVIAWAVPIRDFENKVNCSVTLSGPTYRANNLDQNQAIYQLKETALEVERILRQTAYRFQ
ncbi:IclR family transcriptional regulator [Fundicoccus culcitae]|uniref:IclR family transcriptional regulator n=1 Tax=Fundicoccus culcitae TaxID=2969821 RepID=A0ABY5P494_9LACT|nr:IclR family transcriptional regulator [Fundicoccus culcitae]UUX33406.1 IclR family transcriptional regulator [Fundicoccus culcitae]